MKIRATIFAGFLFVIMLGMALCRPMSAFAASTLTISSTGNGVFLLQGIGIEDAAGLEIMISYDAATLTKPRVVEGPLIAGAMTAVNQKVPGMVRMVIIRLTPVKGKGVIATLTFDRTGSSPGRIISLSAKLANIKGASIPVSVKIYNEPGAAVTDSNPSKSQTTSKRTK